MAFTPQCSPAMVVYIIRIITVSNVEYLAVNVQAVTAWETFVHRQRLHTTAAVAVVGAENAAHVDDTARTGRPTTNRAMRINGNRLHRTVFVMRRVSLSDFIDNAAKDNIQQG